MVLEELESRTLMAAALVAAYNFDQVGSAGKVADASGNGHGGRVFNAAWVSGGKYGGALSFSGALNSLVSVPDSPSLHLTTGMTLEAWVDPKGLKSPHTGWSAVMAKDHRNSSNDVSYALYAADGIGTPAAAHVLIGSTDTDVQGSSVLPLNTWSFLAATYDGSQLTMYVNGVQVGSRSLSGNVVSTTDALRIGGDWSGEMFTGLIDDVRIYNGALTQAAIQADMTTPISSQVQGSSPSVSAVTPARGATGVSTGTSATVAFGGMIDASTVNGSTVQLLNSANVAVSAAVAFNATSETATLTPSNALTTGTTYTVLVHGGSSGAVVKDTAGHVLAANFTSSFTTDAVAPVANAGPAQTANEGVALTFNGSVTGGTGPLSYAWNFGDGATAAGALKVSHTYTGDGSYTASLTVTDAKGRASTSTAGVTVNDVAPTGNLVGPYSSTPGTAISFQATGTVPDPSDVLSYQWNFGDGATSTQQSPTHAYASVGTYTVTLTVRDQEGANTTSSTKATVSQATGEVFPNNIIPPALPAPTGSIVRVSTVSELQAAVAGLQSGQTILINPGTYNLTDTLYVPQGVNNISIRGATGKAADVNIWGQGMSGSVLYGIWVGNSTGDTFGDFTIGNVADHCFIFNAGVQSPLIHNVNMVDAGQQFVKSNPDGNGGGVNNGIVEYSTMQYTTSAPTYYTNGVDVHTGANWIIRNNLFKNILTQGALAGPAILVWNGSQNFTVEANTFINCQREIAFGLDSTRSNDNTGGIIRNNFIYRSGGQNGDVAIGLLNSANSEVANNTIILNGDFVNAIEYRFSVTTGVSILYNLTDAAVTVRDGATGTVTGNVTNAQSSWFVNEGIGNLDLTAAATPAIGQAGVLPEVVRDYNGVKRPTSSAPDVGADQYNGTTTPAPAPTVTGVTPANGATNVPTATSVIVTFSGAVDPTTVTSGTVQLVGPSKTAVAASVTFDAAADKATLTPTSALAINTTYTVLVHGGSGGAVVKNTAGTALAANFTSSFTTDPPAPPPPPPVGNAGPNESGPEGSTVTFAGSATGGQPQLTYQWSFGDGGIASGTLTPSHVYKEAGSYTAILTVTDSLGRSSASSDTVTVSDVTPTANAGGPYSAAPGASISFTGSGTDSPADVSAGLKYAWAFGDGATSALQNPSHAYASAGTFQVSLTVTDADGLTASANATATVTATSSPPVANAGPNQSAAEGSTVTFAGSATGGQPQLTYQWSFGDGGTASATLTPTHVYQEAGTYTATLTVTDSLNRSSSSSDTITVSDVTPTANAGGPYSAAPGSAIAFTGSGTDSPVDTATLQYSWAFGDGTTSTLQNPSHAYANAGTFTAQLSVKDADGLTATASATVSAINNTQEPLLHQNNLQYVGAFGLPSGTFGSSVFDYGGTALAFNPANNSLFLVGHDWNQAVAEVAIPRSIVNSTQVSDLATASVLQPFVSVLSKIPNDTLAGRTVKIGGLLVQNGQLVGTAYDNYDGAGSAVGSHFTLSSLNLATANVQGYYQVGNVGPGFVAGYMTPIPTEWQAALGAPYLTGQAALNIIGRTSSGPAAFGFDPKNLGSSVAPATPYVYYPLSNPLGIIDSNNPFFTGNTEIKGAAFVPGTRTILFFGDNGTNTVGYGEAATFNDGNRTSKGWHSQNGDYTYEVWAYNVDDFIAVKNGRLQPWQIKPYQTWNFDLPTQDGSKHIGGVAFDPKTMRLYVSQLGGDTTSGGYMPLIQVYQLVLNPVGPGQQIGSLSASPNPVTAGSMVTLTAGNVQNSNPGGSVVQVAFYLDSNRDGSLEPSTDTLLGYGTQNGTTWTLTFSSSNLPPNLSIPGLPKGTFRLFAQAKDNDGLFSDPLATLVTVI